MKNTAIYNYIGRSIHKYRREHNDRSPERVLMSRRLYRLYLELWRQCGTYGDQFIATIEAGGLTVCCVPVSVYACDRAEYCLAEACIPLWNDEEEGVL